MENDSNQLIDSIIEDLIYESSNISDTLRKTKVFASKINNEALMKWINDELYGYEDHKNIPSYRVYNASILMGKFVSLSFELEQVLNLKDLNSPELEKLLPIFKCSDSVGQIFDDVKEVKTSNFHLYVDPIYKKLFSFKSINALCIHVWRVVPKNFFVGIIDKTKSYLLDFFLLLQKEFPDEISFDILKNQKENVSQIFDKTIYQITTNISNSTGVNLPINLNSPNSTFKSGIKINAFEDLVKALKEFNIPEKTINELRRIDKNSPEAKNKVKEWFDSLPNKLADNVLKKAVDKALDPTILYKIGALLQNYFGNFI